MVNVPLAGVSFLFLARQLNVKRCIHTVILLRRLKLDILSSVDKSAGTASRATSGGAVLSSHGSGLSINLGMGGQSDSD